MSFFAISPDGYLLSLKRAWWLTVCVCLTCNPKIFLIPVQAGRIYRSPSWSPDGKQVVVVSATVQDNREVVGDRQMVLYKGLGPRIIGPMKGLSIAAFFRGRKSIYYFNGKKKESGKAPASRYDLHAVDLSVFETQLTHEEFYQACDGDVRAAASYYALRARLWMPSARKPEMLCFYTTKRRQRFAIQVYQSSGIFDFSCPRRDIAGNLYLRLQVSGRMELPLIPNPLQP